MEGVRQGHVACRVDIGGSVGGRNGEYLLAVSFAVVGEVIVRRGVGAYQAAVHGPIIRPCRGVTSTRYKAEGPCRHRAADYIGGHILRPGCRRHGPYMDGEGLCVAEHRRSIGRVGGRNRACEHLLARAGVYECLGVVGLIELCVVVQSVGPAALYSANILCAVINLRAREHHHLMLGGTEQLRSAPQAVAACLLAAVWVFDILCRVLSRELHVHVLRARGARGLRSVGGSGRGGYLRAVHEPAVRPSVGRAAQDCRCKGVGRTRNKVGDTLVGSDGYRRRFVEGIIEGY